MATGLRLQVQSWIFSSFTYFSNILCAVNLSYKIILALFRYVPLFVALKLVLSEPCPFYKEVVFGYRCILNVIGVNF